MCQSSADHVHQAQGLLVGSNASLLMCWNESLLPHVWRVVTDRDQPHNWQSNDSQWGED